VTMSIPVSPPPFDKLSLIKQLCIQMKILDLTVPAKQAFISTAGPAAVVKALNKLNRPEVEHTFDRLSPMYIERKHMKEGLRRLWKMYELDRCKIDCPSWSAAKIFGMKFPGEKSGGFGIRVPTSQDIGNEQSKAKQFMTTANYLVGIIETMRAILRAESDPVVRLTKLRALLREVTAVVTKMAFKPELRQNEKDREKVRIFFLVPLLHYIVSKVLCEPLHDYMMNRKGFRVGNRWLGGGARKYAAAMGAWDEDRTFGCGDVGGKDTKFKASDISILLASILRCYRMDGSDEAFITQVWMEWLVDNTAYHIVNWPGGFRFVVGLLFSGDYNTSFLNTMHVLWAIHSYGAWCHDVHGMDPVTTLRNGVPVLSVWVQGDDVTMSSCDDRFDIHSLNGYLKKWDLELKEDSVVKTKQFFADVDLVSGMIRTPPDQCIVFLKRVIYTDGHVVRPFRDIRDIGYRLYHTTTGVPDHAQYCAKLAGLMLDTMGTNEPGWRFCRAMIGNIIKQKRATLEGMVSAMEGDYFVKTRMYKQGLQDASAEAIWDLTNDKSMLLERVDGYYVTPEEEYLHKQSYDDRPMMGSKY